MSTYVLMKILESAPCRYDRGIRILTFGRLDKVYDRLTSHIKRGQRVLDIGCGTGALTLRAAKRGAEVKGIDINSRMLEIAKKRSVEANLEQNIELYEMGVAELGNEKEEDYDIVMSGLCFSELTEDELTYSLKQIKRVLRSGGTLLIADEVMAENLLKRILSWLIRFPLIIITYIITQTTTRAVKNLPHRIQEAGFIIESVRYDNMGRFIELVARKPEAPL